jgi:DNA replication protein DnaC
MNAASATMTAQAIEQHCKLLRLPTVGVQFETLAQQALRDKQTPISYLEALLSAEMEDREKRTIERRLREARLPRLKTLEEFDFTQTKAVTAPQMAAVWPKHAELRHVHHVVGPEQNPE